MQLTAVLARRSPVASVRYAVLRAAIRRAAPPFLLSRAGLVVLTIIANGSTFDLWRWWFWDGSYYATIAARGYTGHPGWYAWFPLLPLVEHAIAGALQMPAFYAGLLIANGSCFAVCVMLEMLTARHVRGLSVSALLLASPFAFFLAAPYTEAPFLLLVGGCLLALRRGWLWRAALCVALATALRPTGVALVLPLVYCSWRQYGASWRAVALVSVALSGILAYALYCYAATGNALAWATAEHTAFGHTLMWPWQTVGLVAYNLGTHVTVAGIADTVAVVLGLVLLLLCARHLPREVLLCAAACMAPLLVEPVGGTRFGPDPLLSAGRYLLPVLFLLLPTLARSAARHPRITAVCVTGCVVAQAALALFELRHGWLP